MATDSQTCPSCKTSKYNNPQLRLMVNLCGHSLCESCVEILFARGSGHCVQCKAPIRKANFRYQLFEDPTVQKEVDIRKKILSEFNKREEDFDTIEEYDEYLEMVEDIIYKLSNDVDVDKTKKFIEQYKKDNKEVIKRNRTKQSSCAEFYERELEQERILRERQAESQAEEEAAELHRRKRQVAAHTLQGFLCGPASVPLPEDPPVKPEPSQADSAAPASSLQPPPSELHAPPSAALDSKYRFIPPPSSAFQRPAVPVSAFPNRWGPGGAVPPTPVSSLFGISPFVLPTQPVSASSWATSAEHHNEVIPKPDTVVFPRSQAIKRSASSTSTTLSALKADAGDVSATARTLDEWLKPYQPDMVGPQPPKPSETPDLMTAYMQLVVAPTTKRLDGDVLPPSERPFADEMGEESGEEAEPRGVSHALPRGSTGIAPSVYLSRALEESRCFLFSLQ